MASGLYWRLSAFYLLYFASLGALVPYWSVYLQARGFSAAQIGELMALLMATKIVAPNLWGWLADHSGRRMAVIRSASLLSLLTFLGVFWVGGYWGMALVMAAFSFFWNASSSPSSPSVPWPRARPSTPCRGSSPGSSPPSGWPAWGWRMPPATPMNSRARPWAACCAGRR